MLSGARIRKNADVEMALPRDRLVNILDEKLIYSEDFGEFNIHHKAPIFARLCLVPFGFVTKKQKKL
jgi:hypothetical protein